MLNQVNSYFYNTRPVKSSTKTACDFWHAKHQNFQKRLISLAGIHGDVGVAKI